MTSFAGREEKADERAARVANVLHVADPRGRDPLAHATLAESTRIGVSVLGGDLVVIVGKSAFDETVVDTDTEFGALILRLKSDSIDSIFINL